MLTAVVVLPCGAQQGHRLTAWIWGRRLAGLNLPVALADSPKLRDNLRAQDITGQLDHFLSEGTCDTRQPQRDRHPRSSAAVLVRLRLGDEPRVAILITEGDAGYAAGG
jgi:hypothetical protein